MPLTGALQLSVTVIGRLVVPLTGAVLLNGAGRVMTQPHPPLTWTGVVRFVVVPSPSWPLPFHPQANRQVVSFRPKV